MKTGKFATRTGTLRAGVRTPSLRTIVAVSPWRLARKWVFESPGSYLRAGKRVNNLSHILLALCLLLLTPLHAEVYDGVAVSIGTHAIKTSEIERDIRLTAFLNGAPLNFSTKEKHKATDRLIDQMLIREEMVKAHVATSLGADIVFERIKSTRFAAPGEYEQALKTYGIGEPELKAHLAWQLAVLAFVDVRFKANPPFFAWLDTSRKNLRIQYRGNWEQ